MVCPQGRMKQAHKFEETYITMSDLTDIVVPRIGVYAMLMKPKLKIWGHH